MIYVSYSPSTSPPAHSLTHHHYLPPAGHSMSSTATFYPRPYHYEALMASPSMSWVDFSFGTYF